MATKDADRRGSEHRLPQEANAIRELLGNSKLTSLTAILEAADKFAAEYKSAHSNIRTVTTNEGLHFNEDGGCTDPFIDITDSLEPEVEGTLRVRNVHDINDQKTTLFSETDMNSKFRWGNTQRHIRGWFQTAPILDPNFKEVHYDALFDDERDDNSRVKVEINLGQENYLVMEYCCKPSKAMLPLSSKDLPEEEEAEGHRLTYYGQDTFTAEAVSKLLGQFGLV